jgi:hypothetical protein
MEIRKFIYESKNGIKEREVLVVEEPEIKGKQYIRGFDLLSMPSDMANAWRKAAPYVTADEINQMLKLNEDAKDIEAPEFVLGLPFFRIYSKDKMR